MGVQIAFDFGDFDEPERPQDRASSRGRRGAIASPSAPPSAGLTPPLPGLGTLPSADALPAAPPLPPATPGTPAPSKGRERLDVVPRWSRAELQEALCERTRQPLRLLLTDNERTMISTREQAGVFTVRIHHMFQHASHEVLDALAGYLTKTDASAGDVLGRFIASQRGRIRRTRPRKIRLRPVGEHHDLQAIFEQLNHRYFDGQVDAHITWSRRSAGRANKGAEGGPNGQGGQGSGGGNGGRRSIKLGSYASRDRLIRIHPVLDAEWVPEFFVAFIIYHEMLHQVVPPRRQGGRREFHGPDFRARERRFAHYEKALAWEQRYLRRLLRA